MKKKYYLVIILIFFTTNFVNSQNTVKYSAFSFDLETNLPGSPEFIYDNLTGDISPWWDHSFSENPDSIYIEPFPGGGFYETFDNQGNGASHATVIYAKEDEKITLSGPLGLSGKAINIVFSYELKQLQSDSTNIKLSVHASGEIEDGIPEIVKKVWEHFLFEQFKPYIENRKQ